MNNKVIAVTICAYLVLKTVGLVTLYLRPSISLPCTWDYWFSYLALETVDLVPCTWNRRFSTLYLKPSISLTCTWNRPFSYFVNEAIHREEMSYLVLKPWRDELLELPCIWGRERMSYLVLEGLKGWVTLYLKPCKNELPCTWRRVRMSYLVIEAV